MAGACRWGAMASPVAKLRRRAWVERARVAAMAGRILEVDNLFLRYDGDGVLTPEEARSLRTLIERLSVVPA
jgi:hypothetical protein